MIIYTSEVANTINAYERKFGYRIRISDIPRNANEDAFAKELRDSIRTGVPIGGWKTENVTEMGNKAEGPEFSMARRKITDAERSAILADFAAGTDIGTMSAKYGRSPEALRHIRRDAPGKKRR